MISSIYIGVGIGALVYCGFIDREFTDLIENTLHPRCGDPITDSLINMAIGWAVFLFWPLFLLWRIWSWRR